MKAKFEPVPRFSNQFYLLSMITKRKCHFHSFATTRATLGWIFIAINLDEPFFSWKSSKVIVLRVQLHIEVTHVASDPLTNPTKCPNNSFYDRWLRGKPRWLNTLAAEVLSICSFTLVNILTAWYSRNPPANWMHVARRTWDIVVLVWKRTSDETGEHEDKSVDGMSRTIVNIVARTLSLIESRANGNRERQRRVNKVPLVWTNSSMCAWWDNRERKR